MGRKKKQNYKILSEAELKLMTIIWSLGEATVHEVKELLPQENEYAYNTVSTIVRILEQKEYLQSRKDGRSHIYTPLITREEYEEIGVDNIVEELFDGTPMALMKRLLISSKLNKDDIKELKELIKNKD